MLRILSLRKNNGEKIKTNCKEKLFEPINESRISLFFKFSNILFYLFRFSNCWNTRNTYILIYQVGNFWNFDSFKNWISYVC